MKTTPKERYEVPTAEVVELKYDGIICNSIPGEASVTMDGTFVEEYI